MSVQTVLVGLATAVLVVSALLVLVRIVRGPSVLDRTVASEVLVSIIACALGLEAAVNRHSTTLPILVSLSLIGFVGSVAIARFVARDHDRGTDEPSPRNFLGRSGEDAPPRRSAPSRASGRQPVGESGTRVVGDDGGEPRRAVRDDGGNLARTVRDDGGDVSRTVREDGGRGARAVHDDGGRAGRAVGDEGGVPRRAVRDDGGGGDRG